MSADQKTQQIIEHDRLRRAVLDYLSEVDNPVADYMHRRVLRDRLRKLVGAESASAEGK